MAFRMTGHLTQEQEDKTPPHSTLQSAGQEEWGSGLEKRWSTGWGRAERRFQLVQGLPTSPSKQAELTPEGERGADL